MRRRGASESSSRQSPGFDNPLEIEPAEQERRQEMMNGVNGNDAADAAAMLQGNNSGVGEEEANPDGSVDLRIFTLNCWGLRFISAKRRERFEAIGRYLSGGNYDVVMLQEVWNEEDFLTVKTAVAAVFPHSHFFDNGIIGSGTCIFSRTLIFDATFHEFGMNGYPHKIWHGDWFGGKGLGVCQIEFKGFDVHLYTSHYHAEYNRKRDVYLGHRVSHGLESAQWIKLTSASADLTVYAGDFNTEPTDVPYKLVRAVAPLRDAWIDVHGDGPGGETCEVPGNSFTSAAALRECPRGKRIDYIMYGAGPNVLAAAVECEKPLPQRISGKEFSYSDHEAVCATIKLIRSKDVFQKSTDFRRMLSKECRIDCVKAVKDAIGIIERSQNTVNKDHLRYGMIAAVFLILFVLTFLPGILVDPKWYGLVDVLVFVPRFLFTVAFVFFVLMATIFNKKEKNALSSTKSSLRLILDQDKIQRVS